MAHQLPEQKVAPSVTSWFDFDGKSSASSHHDFKIRWLDIPAHEVLPQERRQCSVTI